jgi:GNAT superfamily N-acetyltransferase
MSALRGKWQTVDHDQGFLMSDKIALCSLRKPCGNDEWQAYHDIRRRSLFETYLPHVVYDPNHPDENRDGNHPLMLICDGRAVGTIRIDVLDDEKVSFRLVAIDQSERGRGLGAELLRQAERYAVDKLGRREILMYANRNAY